MEDIKQVNIFKNDVFAYCSEEDTNNMLDYIYPIGSLYVTSLDNFDPSSSFGGKWKRIAQGRVIIGEGTSVDINDEEQTFDIDTEGGEYRHILLQEEIPSHKHHASNCTLNAQAPWGVATWPLSHMSLLLQTIPLTSTSNTGNNSPHNNTMAYEAKNIWERYE